LILTFTLSLRYSRNLRICNSGTPAYPAGTGVSRVGVSGRTPQMPVQPTRGRGWSSLSGARMPSTGPGGSAWSGGGGSVRTRSGNGGRRARAGAGGTTTTKPYSGIVFFFLLIHLLFSIIMTFILLVFSHSIV